MIIGPKYKICKRLGNGVFEKCQTQKYALSEERRNRSRGRGRRPKALSDYAKRLIEKQKVRFSYGLSEKQLSAYAREAMSQRNIEPATHLYELLESRLDSIAYRSGLATTRRFARQLVSHGHVSVNDRRVTIPSFQVRTGDTFAVREGSRTKALFAAAQERLLEQTLPHWLTFDSGKLVGTVTATPTFEATDLFDLKLVLEFYSK